MNRYGVKGMRDRDLLERERRLEVELDAEHSKVDEALDDEITRYYGIGGEVAEMVGRKAREIENELDALSVEIEWRALRAWAREPEGERQHRREKFLHPALRRDGYFGDRWCERLERLAR